MKSFVANTFRCSLCRCNRKDDFQNYSNFKLKTVLYHFHVVLLQIKLNGVSEKHIASYISHIIKGDNPDSGYPLNDLRIKD